MKSVKSKGPFETIKPFKVGASAGCGILLTAAFLTFGVADGSNAQQKEVSKAATDTKAIERAKAAVDKLTEKEENTQMPLPGQGYSHSSLLLDKAKDEKAIDQRIEQLKSEGKIKEK